MLAANQAYLISIGVKQEDMQNYLEAMQKYKGNEWWLSNDPRTRAYYQFDEEILLMSFSQFHKDIEVLLDRPVSTHEIRGVKFHQEVECAWKYGVGATSDKERVERFEESVQDMGKEVNIIDFGEGSI